jgi:hypothetical protein
MLASANSIATEPEEDILSIEDIPFDELEAEEEENGDDSAKENIPPGKKSKFDTKKGQKLSKKTLKEVHRQSELLKRTAPIAPPKTESSFSNTNLGLNSFLNNYHKRELRKIKDSKSSNGRKLLEPAAILDKKPWAKLLTKDQLDRISGQKPNLSFDSERTTAHSSEQPIIIIKTDQCSRSDATKRIIKQGIVSTKPVKNSIEQLNRSLQAKISEQSTEAWKLRKESFRRKTHDELKKRNTKFRKRPRLITFCKSSYRKRKKIPRKRRRNCRMIYYLNYIPKKVMTMTRNLKFPRMKLWWPESRIKME